jgi:hypothetical protein
MEASEKYIRCETNTSYKATVEVKLTTLVQMTDLSFLTICSSSVFSHRSKVWNFSKYILSVFPHVKIERLTQGNDRKRFYVGIE